MRSIEHVQTPFFLLFRWREWLFTLCIWFGFGMIIIFLKIRHISWRSGTFHRPAWNVIWFIVNLTVSFVKINRPKENYANWILTGIHSVMNSTSGNLFISIKVHLSHSISIALFNRMYIPPKFETALMILTDTLAIIVFSPRKIDRKQITIILIWSVCLREVKPKSLFLAPWGHEKCLRHDNYKCVKVKHILCFFVWE